MTSGRAGDEYDEYDEIGLIAESAAALGLAGQVPPVRRLSVDAGGGQRVSALEWGAARDAAAVSGGEPGVGAAAGEASPEVVFLHGGGQNAHTWDLVALRLGRPALAIDLPGHGHSDWRPDRNYMPFTAAAAVRAAVAELAPAAAGVVGMSLGGLTAIRLASLAPQLARRVVVVDVTPSVQGAQLGMSAADRGATALVAGPPEYASFDEMLAATLAASPHREPESLRRGVLHNSRRRADGTWVWRYDRLTSAGGDGQEVDFLPLWDDLSRAPAPFTLVRGGNSRFVRDQDVAQWLRRRPETRVEVVPGASHSVQSDAPARLAEIIRESLFGS